MFKIPISFMPNLCKIPISLNNKLRTLKSLSHRNRTLTAGKAVSAAAAQHNASGLTPISTGGAAFRGAMSYAGHSMAQHIGDTLYSGFIKK